ncbi:hypothetical protein [Aquipuribacter sp. MA13-6]|uniref:hypothetical protein n=1 Tax=unclassified Aquipuribacter TaxID=2635084 RepID=UPI003EE9B2C1
MTRPSRRRLALVGVVVAAGLVAGCAQPAAPVSADLPEAGELHAQVVAAVAAEDWAAARSSLDALVEVSEAARADGVLDDARADLVVSAAEALAAGLPSEEPAAPATPGEEEPAEETSGDDPAEEQPGGREPEDEQPPADEPARDPEPAPQQDGTGGQDEDGSQDDGDDGGDEDGDGDDGADDGDGDGADDDGADDADTSPGNSGENRNDGNNRSSRSNGNGS